MKSMKSIEELASAIGERMAKQRREERMLLKDIEILSDDVTAVAAADILSSEKHAYSFEGYLGRLEELRRLLIANIPADTALQAIDCCIDAGTVIRMFRWEDGEKL